MAHVRVLRSELAKQVVQIVGMDDPGTIVWRKRSPRSALRAFIAQMPPVVLGMEAGGGAHDWARRFREHGPTVKLLAPPVGIPYVKPHQHAMAEAAAIGAAVTRPTRRFVPIKEIAQQARQARHRIRERWGNARTALINEVRGVLDEQGIVLPKGIAPFRHAWLSTREHEQAKLTELSRNGCRQLYAEGLALEPRLASSNEPLEAIWQADPACPRLLTMPGGGPLTATVWVTAVREATHGKHGRPFAAGLGLVPRPHAPGGKPRRLGISQRGKRYLRTLVVHGARATIRWVRLTHARRRQWLRALMQRRGPNRAGVALAHKHARMAWVLLATDPV